MTTDLLSALCLVLVIEGILPFLSPARYRAFLEEVSTMSDRALRTAGAIAMIIGAILLMVVRG